VGVRTDRGKTWSEPVDTGIWGCPAHLLLLPDGTLATIYHFNGINNITHVCLTRWTPPAG
jgi:hypothetical protein